MDKTMGDKELSTVIAAILSISLGFKLVVLAVVIFFGANTYALMALKNAKDEKQFFSKYDYIHSIIIAIFSGMMFFLISLLVKDSWIFSWVAAGIGSMLGYSGISTMGDKLIDIMLNSIGRKK